MQYRLYKHLTKTNKWLVVRLVGDIREGYAHIYDVGCLPNGTTYYTEIRKEN